MLKKLIKKSIKSMFLILMLLITALTFSACAQVRVMTITNDDDTIDELVSVTLITDDIENAGYSVEDLKKDIEDNSKTQAQYMVDKLNSQISLDLILVHDEESIKILNGYKDGIDVIKSNWENNTYTVGIRFKNIDVYKYYYNIKDNVKTETYTKEHFFYDKVYYYASTMYVKHHDLYDQVKRYYSSQYPGLIDSESNELLYTYKTNLRRQHSDADYITKQDGEYYHTWVVDPEKIDEPIILYYNVANPENWIIVSICVTLGVTVILSFIGVIINITKKNNQPIETKKDDK